MFTEERRENARTCGDEYTAGSVTDQVTLPGPANGARYFVDIVSYIISSIDGVSIICSIYVTLDVLVSFHYECCSWRAGQRGS